MQKPTALTFPTNPFAKNIAELATPKQIVMIRAMYRDLDLDLAELLQQTWTSSNLVVEELSKSAAKALIDHLKQLQSGEQPARALPIQPTQKSGDNMITPAKFQHLFLNAGHPGDASDGFDHLSLQSDSNDLKPLIDQRLAEGWELWINGTMGTLFAALLFRASTKYNVFCFGSPTVKGLPLRVAGALSKIIRQQGRFLLTDEAGISSRFQLFLTDDRYPEVALYHVGDKPFINHGNFPMVKVVVNWETDFFQATQDDAIRDAHFGLALYDETNHVVFGRPAKNDPTLDLTRKMLEAGKPVKFFFTGCDAVINLKTTTDFAQIEAALTENFL